MSRLVLLARLVPRLLSAPRALGPALRAAWRFRARDWYRRPPFLPLPPAEYLEWRLHTAYGDEGTLPSAAELERYLRWAERMRQERGLREVGVW